ncbi:MAG TPA: ATP synthase F1 subunit delta [Pyrinomonadaceae bacterium]|nr:ATP synthase F1 subunit delta [Pyrinomonadaceae bacterium]
MSVETVARRYAAALADVVMKSGEAAAVRSELSEWVRLVSENESLRAAFSNPSIAHLDKENILEKIIAKTRPSRSTANFLRVLLQNGRLTELAEITERFDSELEERSGNVVARVTSARELGENEKRELMANLAALTGKNIKPEYAVDNSLIGGVVTQVGSIVYDGSVRTKLENLREELING